MKIFSYTFLIAAGLFLGACHSDEASLYTDNELQYNLIKGSYFDQQTSGYLIVRERSDQSLDLKVHLDGTLTGAIHPVHLHFGSLADDQPVAAWLNPVEDVNGGQGESLTHLTSLDDGTPITFAQFKAMNASLKIHFEETGQLKDVILGATNIGQSYRSDDATTFKDITICNSRTGR